MLSLSLRGEAVWAYGDTKADGLPRFERLFLGTENDLRGFAIRGVGPRSGNVVVGGDRSWYGAIEHQLIVHPRLRLATFLDAGNVYASDFDGEKLPLVRADVGAEVQWLTPIWNIPLRLGYAVNVDPVLDENRGRFFFAMSVRF